MTVDTQTIRNLLSCNENDRIDFKQEFYDLSGDTKEQKNAKAAAMIKDILSLCNTIRNESAYIVCGVREEGNVRIVCGLTNLPPDDADLQGKLSAERLQLLRDRYAGQVSFYFINPGESTDTNPASSFSLLPFYADGQQQLLRILDPHKTPEAFLLKKQNTKLTLVYRGAIDDNPQMASAVTQPWLQSAIDNLRDEKAPAQAEVRASGCTIRKK
jgi:hypothetical protein